MPDLTLSQISFLEEKLNERYEKECNEKGLKLRDKKFRYPKFGELMREDKKELLHFVGMADNSLPAIMLKDAKTKQAIKELWETETNGGKKKSHRWYPNPFVHFANKREKQNISHGIFEIYREYIGFSSKEEFEGAAAKWAESKNQSSSPTLSTLNPAPQLGSNSGDLPEGADVSPSLPSLRRRLIPYAVALVVVLALSGLVCKYFWETDAQPSDPLGIVGRWNYVVTPIQDNKPYCTRFYGLLPGFKDSTNILIPKYTSLTGYIVIKFNVRYNKYEITGQRTGAWETSSKKNAIENSPVDLRFTYVSFEQLDKKGTLFFKFRAADKDNSRGFVILGEEGGDILDSHKMEGSITYIHEDSLQQWGNVRIVFYR